MTRYILFFLSYAVLVAGCQKDPPTQSVDGTADPIPAQGTPRPADNAEPATDENVANNFAKLRGSRQAIANEWKDRTFEEFEKTVTRESGTGNYVVNGDVVISDPKRLREFFENEVQKADHAVGLIVHAPGGVPAVWNNAQKQNLTYCVSDTFGASKARVVTDMAAATDAWEQQGDIDFVYLPLQDSNCTAINTQVVFDVRPVNGQSYLARAFFPDDSRGNRNVLINSTAFTTTGKLTLLGILRHELGHTLGFRHEHTRPESGTCFEDNDWVPLTSYDAFSVMHYPQCNGQGDWTLTLTVKDKLGICKQYGAGSEYAGDASMCLQPIDPTQPASGCPQVASESGKVARHAIDRYGPYAVSEGTEFNATMTGSGDPDLYVRFNVAPSQTDYDCRPYLTGPNETCQLTVPANATSAHVMIRGYKAGSYQLQVEHTPGP